MKPPERISGSIPAYPEEAKSRGHEGAPVVDLLISEEGEILEARLAESAGPLLDQALLDAVKGWRFSPATSEGVAVSVRFLVQHVFRS
jgi:protein TonB